MAQDVELFTSEIVAVEPHGYGYQFVLACGHAIYSAVKSADADRLYCGRCFNDYVESRIARE